MNARRNGFALAAPTLGVAALVLATLVAVIGSAQAAPSTKKYDASVRVTGNQVVVPDGQTSAISATLRLTLTNTGRQTLGSADFTPPLGVTPSGSVFAASRSDWTVKFEEGVVKFRSSSGAAALTSGGNGVVSADVPVAISGCTDALWRTAAKQSNDFSGQPGNSFLPGVLDLTPLGSFAVNQIVTVRGGQTIPALETGTPFEWTATAYDLCGNVKTSYSGATLSRTFLTAAAFNPSGGLSLSWEDGVGTVIFTPTLTETGNKLTVTDTGTGVTKSSNFFDVSDTICVPAAPGVTDPCRWQDKPGNSPDVVAETVSPLSPPSGANLGIGFNSSVLSPPRANFSCNNTTTPVGSSPVVNINPSGYGAVPFTVSVTYKKSVTGNGAASGFVVCFSKSGDSGTWAPMPACPASPPCVQTQKRTSGGDLQIVFYLTQGDPWTGLG